MDAASGFVEMSKEPQQKQKEAPGESSRRRKAKVPERPLTCPGLHPRKHPLASHPTLGVRPPSTPSIPLPQWQPPMTNIEYTHQKPFESAFFDQPLAQPYVVGGVLPNSSGHFTERRRDGTGVYTRAHAAQSLEALRANPQRPTDWAQENLHHRHKSFHQLKVLFCRKFAPCVFHSSIGLRTRAMATLVTCFIPQILHSNETLHSVRC